MFVLVKLIEREELRENVKAVYIVVDEQIILRCLFLSPQNTPIL